MTHLTIPNQSKTAVIGVCNGDKVFTEKHFHFDRECRDGDFAWAVEYHKLPEWWTQEKHDSGDYDPIEHSIESISFHLNKSVAIKFYKDVVAAGNIQWHPRYRRVWWNEDTHVWDYEENTEWMEA